MGFLSAFFGGKVRNVTPDDAHRMVQEGAQLIDVRQRRELKTIATPLAKHIPLHALATQVQKLDPDRPVLCLCATGNRSTRAARILTDAGFDSHSVRGGIGAWARSGLPVRSG